MSFSIADALKRLQQCVKEGRVAHAYLFTGSDALLEQDLIVPWLTTLIGAVPHQHPDIFHIRPQSKMRQIRVEQIQELISFLNQSSLMGGWKIGILHKADRLNMDAANKFLKTLEEPAPKMLILLTSERPEQLLPTIRSRCLTLRIHNPMPKIIPEELKQLLHEISRITVGDITQTYHLLTQTEFYLSQKRTDVEYKSDQILAKAKEEGLESEGMTELEKSLTAQAETEYRSQRTHLLGLIMETFGPQQPRAVQLLESAQLALHRNLPEGLVLERLFVQLSQPN